jgi:hypothetical protein
MISETAPARPDQASPPTHQRATDWCRGRGISIQTFHRWRLRPDGPPALKIFGVWYVDPIEMARWIESRSQRPSSPPPAVPVLSAARRRDVQKAIDECIALGC